MPHDVFISYSSKDKAIANAACAALEAQKIRCWIAPRDIVAGFEYGAALIDAIIACQIFVLIFSREANESPQVCREVERAMSKEKIIIPLRIENILPSKEMEYYLSSTHWLDALTPPVEAHIATLVATVRSFLVRRDCPIEQIEPAPKQGPVTSFSSPASIAAPSRSRGRGMVRAIYSLSAVFLAGIVFSLIYNVTNAAQGGYEAILSGLPIYGLMASASISAILFMRNPRFRRAALILEYFCVAFWAFGAAFWLVFVLGRHSQLSDRIGGTLTVSLLIMATLAFQVALTVLLRRVPVLQDGQARGEKSVGDARASFAFRLSLIVSACVIGGGGLGWWAQLSQGSRLLGPLYYLRQFGYELAVFAALLTPVGLIKAWLALRQGTHRRKRAIVGLALCGAISLSLLAGMEWWVLNLSRLEAASEARFQNSVEGQAVAAKINAVVAESLEDGNRCKTGTGVAQNYVLAVQFYRTAVAGDSAEGMRDLGYMYEHGFGVDKDEGEAIGWYRKAADAGDAQGMAYLGRAYELGLSGKSGDDNLAVVWYLKGAEAGNADAMRSLAVMYASGRGNLAKDPAEASKWYLEAANRGDVEAMKFLAQTYATGGGGLTADATKAAYWAGKVTAAGTQP